MTGSATAPVARDPLCIRDAEDADEASWRRLWAEYCVFYQAKLAADVTDFTWRRIRDPASPVFARLAEQGSGLAGFAVCVLHEATWTAAPVCYLEDLFVLPSLRRAGIGRRLIEDLLALAAARGWSRLYWHTEAGNAPARRLYDTFTGADDYVRYRIFLTPPASAR